MDFLLVPLVFLITLFSTLWSIQDPLDIPVKSWEHLEVSSLNSQIEHSLKSGAKWPYSALKVSLNFFGDDSEIRALSLSEVANSGENPDTIVVTIARDGFLDDSTRGDWYQVTLKLSPDRVWWVDEVRRAHSCWRGVIRLVYSTKRCL